MVTTHLAIQTNNNKVSIADQYTWPWIQRNVKKEIRDSILLAFLHNSKPTSNQNIT